LSPPTLSVTHSYPICWRCKHAVIFRATPQWFAALDDSSGNAKSDLRQVALDQIERTEWIPPWGKNRIRGMIEHRPDWVLSRQRVWGVPIPIFYRDGKPLVDAGVMEHVAKIFEQHGADAWFARSAAELLPPGYVEKNPGTYEKERDIVDVWFESGVSGAAVCQGRPGLDSHTDGDGRFVDLYLEGSDQHRGWFHSTLLVGCANDGHPPYRAVLTHGFVLDDRGKPYSKSEIEKARREGKKVEYIPPEDVLKQQGAELLRLWVAQADFRTDVAYSRGHLTQLGESYRKIRNTARFLLGNLDGFDPAQESAVKLDDPLDVHMAARVDDFSARVHAAYEAYEFHLVFRALVDFATVDLSALYCDVRKDRLYCDAKNSPERLATQVVLYRALRAMVTAMAPILCFTADDIWSYTPHRKGDPDSVHLATLERGRASEIDPAIATALEWRERVKKELEAFRAQKKSSLDAQIVLTAPQEEVDRAARFSSVFLADLFIVSRVEVKAGEPSVQVSDASGTRCDRCWKWTPDAPICARCKGAVGAGGTK
jgi:isoleucyl-tRNA synthetase